ncbi:MAG: YwmB family TATA-box binding protein [Tuberibacillus sp.]
MKRTFYAIAFLLFLFFGALAHTQAMSQIPPTEKVPQLVQALKDEGARIQNWSLYARHQTEVKSPQDFYKKAEQLKGTFDSFHWSRKKYSDGKLEMTGVKNSPYFNGEEHIIIFSYPRKGALVTYIIYELKGSSWDGKKWVKFSSTLNHRLDLLFQQNGKLFACAQGFYSDKMDIVISKKTKEILSRFHAHVIEQVEEKTFESVSAYTNDWKDSIKTNGRKMNLQVGLRTIKEGTTVTIGTPIITTEY